MSAFKDFLCWYDNKDVVPTLGAMPRQTYYHDKVIDMLELGYTLPKLATIFLHKSTDTNFYPFTETNKELLEKIQQTTLVVQLLFLHAKRLLTILWFENQETYANLMFGLMLADYTPTRCVNPCQPVCIHVGTLIPRQVDSHLDKTRPVAFKTWSCPIFNEQDQIPKLGASIQQVHIRKLTSSVLMGCALIAMLCSKQWVAFITFVFVRKFDRLPLRRMFNVVKKRELYELRRSYIREKGFTVVKMWECEWWRSHKTSSNVKKQVRENFPYKRSLAAEYLLGEIKNGNFFTMLNATLKYPRIWEPILLIALQSSRTL